MQNNLKAFLDMIAFSELGNTILAGSDNGYNVLVGSTPEKILTFPNYDTHPNIYNAAMNSTAAGRYQLLHRYFIAYAKLLHLPDFSPSSQDAIAIQQIKEQNALDLIYAGSIRLAILQCNNIWASLPGNFYGQHQQKLSDLLTAYNNAGETLIT